MYQFDVNVLIPPPQARGPKAAELIRMFGISRRRLRQEEKRRFALKIGAGEILFITGASGAGKSMLLRALYEQAPAHERLQADAIPLEDDASAIDCVGTHGAPLHMRLEAINKAGLSDVFCMLRAPAQLSIGQQARYRLAKALAGGPRLIFIDEFTASMDRITALAAAHHLRKAATRSGKTFIIASCHEDIIDELRPDTMIRL